MRTANEVEVVLFKKGLHDIGAECERDSPIVLTPTLDARLRVGTEKIAKNPAVRDVRRPLEPPDLVQGDHLRREIAVHAEDVLLNDGGDWHGVKTSPKIFQS